MDNLKEMDRFLGKFNFPRLNQEEIEIKNKLITNTEKKTKAQGQMASQGNSIKHLETS